jgi:cellobiose phosphorylase
MLNLFIELLEYLNINTGKDDVSSLRDRLVKSVEEFCWDGEWYIRAFGENERRVGSKESKYGKIFLNTQVWPVIAGFPGRERMVMAMDSVKKYLDSPEGPKKCSPAWREIDPNIGLITRCVRGKKENGAVFCHPAAWVIQAETMLGRSNQAFGYFKKMLPNRIDSDIFVAEPYVYSQYITSNEHSQPGRASHSWQTGSAAWMFRVSFDYILGLRPTYSGLMIDPSIPSYWNEFRAERVYRGTRYIIHVLNPDHVEKGVKSIKINGNPIHGQVLLVSEKPECIVEVIMGRVV